VRILPSLPGYIYAIRDKEVYVNLYIGNHAELELEGESLRLSQKTNYPWDGSVELSIENEKEIQATLKLRVPGWARNEVMSGDLYRYIDEQRSSLKVVVNGKSIDAVPEDGYITFEQRKWKSGDKIEIAFGMPVRKVVSHEKVEANKDKMAFERGPLVYCAEEIDNPDGVLNLKLSQKDPFEYSFDPGLFGGLGTIKGQALAASDPVAFMAVPYYAWAHREIGEMSVWHSVK
jgi:DUF1680 family protein